MSPIILAVNAGSSSVKATLYSLVPLDDLTPGHKPPTSQRLLPIELANASVVRLTTAPPLLNYSRGEKTIDAEEVEDVTCHTDAMGCILRTILEDTGLEELSTKDDITQVCHRIVHGGSYTTPHIIDWEAYRRIDQLAELAPLHNGPALEIVRLCMTILPEATNVAFFDTVFHQSIPEPIRTYAIDQKLAKWKGLRKYGFHGLSYSYILRSVSAYLGKPENETNIIALHLGSGASVCAIKDGKSLDTSMGLTPIDGLPGATRCGSVDPSLVLHLSHHQHVGDTKDLKGFERLLVSAAETLLSSRSGWKALTGTADFKDISTSDDPSCRLAFDMLVDRIIGYIGSYFVKLNGRCDALVFSGGIGERSAVLRKAVVDACQFLGFEIDDIQNEKCTRAEDPIVDIGGETSEPEVLVCHTDEQFEMALECAKHEQMLSEWKGAIGSPNRY